MKREPFKFLDSYTKDDQDIFFGRSLEVEELYTRVFYSNLLLVYGASGTGKTSLIQCGLSSKLEDTNWLPIIIRRGQHIVESLNNELTKHAVTKILPDTSSVKIVKSLYLDHFKPVYLIFDQFEELFIFGKNDERIEIAKLLIDILNSDTEVKVILVIREEYLALLTGFEEYLPELFQNRIRIERMSIASAVEAIEEPLRVCEVGIEDRLAPIILERLGSDTANVELTYLQVIMDRLYKMAVAINSDNPLITHNDLMSLGKLGDVLGNFLKEQLGAMADPELGEAVLKAMVSTDGTKKVISIDDIVNTLETLGIK